MKWFKHYTDASDDDKISQMEEEFGITGYAVYMKLLEFCGRKFEKNLQPTFHVAIKRFASYCGLSTAKCSSVVRYMHRVALINLDDSKENWIIEIPNMAKIKDNHTSNLQVANKSKPSNLALEEEKRRAREEEEKKKIPPSAVFSSGVSEGKFYYLDCHAIWEELGKSGMTDLWTSHMPPELSAKDFVALKEKYLKTPEQWREYFSALHETKYAEREGFTFPLAVRVATYEKFKNGSYGKRKTPDPMEMFHV